MATTSKIIRWVAGKVLDRAPADGEIPSELDLIEAIEANRPGIVEAQAQAAELAAALGLIGPDGPPGTRDIPVDAWRWADTYRDPSEAMREAMGGAMGGGDPDAILALLEDMGVLDPTRAPRLALAVLDDAGAGIALLLANVHRRWLAIPEADRPRHPLAPLVAAWLKTRPRAPARSTVTVTGGESVAMTRRLAVVSHARMTRWAPVAAVPDPDGGGPMVARALDSAAVFDPTGTRLERARKWTEYRPGEQGKLPLRGLAPLPVDIRLASVADLDPLSAGDVLALWDIADVLDHPMALDELTGARLLARTLAGDFRRPRESDIRRFWDATRELRGTLLFDPAGTGRWAEVAHVESFLQSGRVTIGPPSWRRFGKAARYMLTAEGGRAARARIAVGRYGAAGRLIRGIEYALGARYFGRPGVAPDLRPASGKGGPGEVVPLPLPLVAALMGESDPTADEAARKRLDRAISTARKKYQSGAGRNDTAPAGDSVEIIGRTRGSRAHPAALQVRASARFVEAARRARLADGKGFETVTLADWIGLDFDAQ